MLTASGLLRGVLERPWDTDVRLVFADCLEEEGERQRAEFIRVQCQIAAVGEEVDEALKQDLDQWSKGPLYKKRAVLQRRSQELLLDRSGGLVRDVAAIFGRTKFMSDHGIDGFDAPPGVRWEWSRGFVSGIRLPCALFMEHAEAIFGQQPVTRVTLTDKQPYGLQGVLAVVWANYSVSDRDTSDLPPELYALVERENTRHSFTASSSGESWTRYPTIATANEALSVACVAYGRRLAGLPPLTGEFS